MKVVPSYLLDPVIVVKDNIEEALVDSGYWTAGGDRPLSSRHVIDTGRWRERLSATGESLHYAPPVDASLTEEVGRTMTNNILEMRGITKTFPGVKALLERELSRSSAARSTPSAARTAPASRRS